MTKHRAPLTRHRAIEMIGSFLGWDVAGEKVGKTDRMVRKWSEPDTPDEITLADAVTLDLAYMTAGGPGAPLLAWHEAELRNRAASENAGLLRLAKSAARAVKEVGDAFAATFRALAPGASPDALPVAEHEMAEAIEALHHTQQDIAAARGKGETA